MPVEAEEHYRLMPGTAKTFGLFAVWLMAASLLSSCAVAQSGRIKKIALLAPFEGQYRSIGYNALYAVRLATDEAASHDIQLLAVDDGGTVESAIKRIQALNIDPAVEAILVLGAAASHPDVQSINDRPLIIIGNWGHGRADEHTFYAAHQSTVQEQLDSDLLMLGPAADLDGSLNEIVFVSSGRLADEAFYQRYMQSDLHVPAPNLLATITYDVSRLVLGALASGIEIAQAQHEGINGTIRFEAGYWRDAPLNSFRYDGDQLVMLPD